MKTASHGALPFDAVSFYEAYCGSAGRSPKSSVIS